MKQIILHKELLYTTAELFLHSISFQASEERKFMTIIYPVV